VRIGLNLHPLRENRGRVDGDNTVLPDEKKRAGCEKMGRAIDRGQLNGDPVPHGSGSAHHLAMAGYRGFSGAQPSQGSGVFPARGSLSALIQKGDWCGSAVTPSPSERKPKARVRSEHRALRQRGQDRGFATKREARVLDRGQLNVPPDRARDNILCLLFLEHQGPRIAGSVHNARDDDLGIGEAVVKGVIAVEVDPQSFAQMLPAGSDFRVRQQGTETLFDLPDKPRGRLGIILCDEAPDVGQVLLCGVRYAEGSGSCNCCSPFLMIRAASKSCTRPASMSDKPS
jgi:hypothetical protein